MSTDHDVRLDYVGLSARERLTCYTCGATLLRQPYMGATEFKAKAEAWRKEHPGKLENEGWRG